MPAEAHETLILPPPLRRVLPAARWERVNVGESGAGVWKSQKFVVKVQARGGVRFATSLQQERERLRWLAGRVPVPRVVGYEVEDGLEYLALTRVPGLDASHADVLFHPDRLVNLLARALRELHALPLRECPFNMSLSVILPHVRERVAAGVVDESDFDGEREGRTAISVFNELARTRPEKEDLVVTHGDACLPNFIVNGEFIEGLIDVGRAGIADRHADLALTHRSLGRNLSAEAAEGFLDLYGRGFVDPQKLAYYRLLDELF
ncbi:APH(3') family aminoglycoside O-phosphotransferase [Deinococcus sp. AJ005]|uniref:APH(3') family aminoglycoside O-phosphotransferase n=1 Tax=Deinococcus sp. AJ005 TaxID=2652443 RepID=UPI00125CC7C0|nr:APH(3') family aminoglycoside O-phosphotransferase [Deinococcus sp. AJ005]QFP77499.1 aminoglycoside 3'-phosphotransferase [Deinococcus sp. AJ005]